MIITVNLLYKLFFTFRAFYLLMPPVYMNVHLGYNSEMSVTVLTLYLAILVTGVLGHWIY